MMTAALTDEAIDGLVEFRPVAEFPGYRVGSDGSVWSCLKRKGLPSLGQGAYIITDEWKRLKIHIRNGGKTSVTLSRDGSRASKVVHRLILEAFIGSCPDGMEACHFPDRNPANCRLDNLRWDTRSANYQDKVIHGTSLQGERHHQAKLSSEDVIEIRRLYANGSRNRHLRAMFGVSRSTITGIVTRRTWRHLL